MNGWVAVKDVAWGRLFESPQHPAWSIYDQPEGFFVWKGSEFQGSRESFKAAADLVVELGP